MQDAKNTLDTDFFLMSFCSSSVLIPLSEGALGGAGFEGAKNLRMSCRSGSQKDSGKTDTVIS